MTTAQIKIRDYSMPDEARAVFTSPMIARKKRLSLLIEWFMENYYNWLELSARDQGLNFSVLPMSITEFAEGLTRALAPYRIIINRQRVWTWLKERNLPRSDNFNVMVEIAEGWQLDFALLVLGIIASDEPELPKTI